MKSGIIRHSQRLYRLPREKHLVIPAVVDNNADIFVEMGRALLMLGEPASVKTTILWYIIAREIESVTQLKKQGVPT